MNSVRGSELANGRLVMNPKTDSRVSAALSSCACEEIFLNRKSRLITAGAVILAIGTGGFVGYRALRHEGPGSPVASSDTQADGKEVLQIPEFRAPQEVPRTNATGTYLVPVPK
jgi:hypothetical protein